MIKKKQLKIAKLMFKKSLQKDLINPKSVRQVLKETLAGKPSGLIAILKAYKKLIQNALAKKEVIIETGTPLTGQSQLAKMLIGKTNARKISYKINPQIVFGARIYHGDWIWDATMEAKLKQLTIDN